MAGRAVPPEPEPSNSLWGGQGCHRGLRAVLSPLAELSFPHLWLQGSPGAPGPGGSPGTPVSSESREPKPGSGPGFLARGRGCSWPERGRDPSWGAGRDLGTATGPGSSRDSAAGGSLSSPLPNFLPQGLPGVLGPKGQKVGAVTVTGWLRWPRAHPLPLGILGGHPPASLLPPGRASRASCVPLSPRGCSVPSEFPASRDRGGSPERPAGTGSR